MVLNLNDLLKDLKNTCIESTYSKNHIIFALKNLIEWLLQPENDKYINYKKISFFVASELLCAEEIEKLPSDIHDILHDIGSSLDDTYTNPEIAIKFYSTPQQLLGRIQGVIDNG